MDSRAFMLRSGTAPSLNRRPDRAVSPVSIHDEVAALSLGSHPPSS
eukprot:CAMPEP_0171959064 /NCGR_PEP_ID=MMETSP0993-20121228/145039_1 /TAXON_ID=483369 /ORGANISM="non described non described, Strain CCMP2098" /LENGTH=45 /DNA_ID= /DNA_START= /DNA_END= /DNA_ORIENTATION=